MENNLKILRKKHGYSQKSLAATLGVAHTTIWRLEQGDVPKLDLAYRLADLFGVHLEDVFYREKTSQYHVTAQADELTITLVVDATSDTSAQLEAEHLLETKYELYEAEIIEVDTIFKEAKNDQ